MYYELLDSVWNGIERLKLISLNMAGVKEHWKSHYGYSREQALWNLEPVCRLRDYSEKLHLTMKNLLRYTYNKEADQVAGYREWIVTKVEGFNEECQKFYDGLQEKALDEIYLIAESTHFTK